MNDNEHEVQGQGYEAFDMAGRVLTLLQGVVSSATIDESRTGQHREVLRHHHGGRRHDCAGGELPFSVAHHVAADLAKALGASGATLAAVPYQAFVRCFSAATGRAPRLDEAAFRRAATPEHFVAVRALPGGPAPAAMAQSLEVYEAETAELRRLVAAHRARDEAAEARLAAEVLDLTEAASCRPGEA
jgi:argininosuccinate lyase